MIKLIKINENTFVNPFYVQSVKEMAGIIHVKVGRLGGTYGLDDFISNKSLNKTVEILTAN